MADKKKNKKGFGNKNTAAKGAKNGDFKNVSKEVKHVYKSVLYLLPKTVEVSEFSEVLQLERKQVELWLAVNVMEIQLANGCMTLEDITEEVEKTIAEMNEGGDNIKQVYACDYDAADQEAVEKLFEKLVEAFGGRVEEE